MTKRRLRYVGFVILVYAVSLNGCVYLTCDMVSYDSMPVGMVGAALSLILFSAAVLISVDVCVRIYRIVVRKLGK